MNEEHFIRTRRVRIHPTKEQKQDLDKWFGSVRFCYNVLVENYPNVGQGGVNLKVLRDKINEKVQENSRHRTWGIQSFRKNKSLGLPF